MICGPFRAGLLPTRPLLGGNTRLHTETSHSQPGPRPIASSARVQAPPYAARPHRSFYCKTSGQGGPRAALAARARHREKPPGKVTARILAPIVRLSQLQRLGPNASPLRSYHAQQPNNMAKSLVGEDSAPPQATAPLAYVTADRGARSPAPPPLSSFCSSSPPPSRSPSLPSTKKASGESNQGFDSQTQYIVTK